MDHYHDVCTLSQSFAVAGLLVAAVPSVFGMDDGMYPQFCSDHRGFVPRGVINKDHFIHIFMWEFLISLAERLFSIVGRHYYNKFSTQNHMFFRFLKTMVKGAMGSLRMKNSANKMLKINNSQLKVKLCALLIS